VSIYQTVWTPLLGKELVFHREIGNISDPYAVAVIQPGSTSQIVATCHEEFQLPKAYS